jgi:hypothetical protein
MNETEWSSLSTLWASAQEPVDAGLLRKVVRAHRRGLVAVTVGEIVLAIAFAWLSYAVLRDGVEPWTLVWVATLWIFMAAAVAFAWWNRRGTWRALGDSVADYVRLTRVRAERQRRSMIFGVALYVAEVVAVVAQLQWFDRLTPFAIVLLGVASIIVAGWAAIARRKIARDLAMVEEYAMSSNHEEHRHE